MKNQGKIKNNLEKYENWTEAYLIYHHPAKKNSDQNTQPFERYDQIFQIYGFFVSKQICTKTSKQRWVAPRWAPKMYA